MSSLTDPSVRPLPDHVDVLIVGAGLSGIGAAYRLQTTCPGKDYLVLEARASLGGTWDLFTYPGIRSDSDMFTLGYPFRPWRERQAIADGPSILRYLRETAQEFGIEERIRYSTKVVDAEFSRATGRWTVTVEQPAPADAGPQDGGVVRRTVTTNFLYACSGYYNYDRGHLPDFPGLDSFAGTVVHPQFWPQDLDYADKKVVVIGSGATAVTLLPNLARTAASVTMLQRSPTWILAVPGTDDAAGRLYDRVPSAVADRLNRAKYLTRSLGFYFFCRAFPRAAGKLIHAQQEMMLKDPQFVRENLTPRYKPWDQRLCVVPSADLFKALRKGVATIVTDEIDRIVPEGVKLRSGRVLEADILITATGLEVLVGGGIHPRVDGVTVVPGQEFIWNSAMLTGVPNFALCIGYTNASWTLRSDLVSRMVARLVAHMDRHDLAVVEPPRPSGTSSRQVMEMSSGYLQRAAAELPKQAARAPWVMRQNYLLDRFTLPRAGFRRLRTVPRSALRPAQSTPAAVGQGSR